MIYYAVRDSLSQKHIDTTAFWWAAYSFFKSLEWPSGSLEFVGLSGIRVSHSRTVPSEDPVKRNSESAEKHASQTHFCSGVKRMCSLVISVSSNFHKTAVLSALVVTICEQSGENAVFNPLVTWHCFVINVLSYELIFHIRSTPLLSNAQIWLATWFIETLWKLQSLRLFLNITCSWSWRKSQMEHVILSCPIINDVWSGWRTAVFTADGTFSFLWHVAVLKSHIHSWPSSPPVKIHWFNFWKPIAVTFFSNFSYVAEGYGEGEAMSYSRNCWYPAATTIFPSGDMSIWFTWRT